MKQTVSKFARLLAIAAIMLLSASNASAGKSSKIADKIATKVEKATKSIAIDSIDGNTVIFSAADLNTNLAIDTIYADEDFDFNPEAAHSAFIARTTPENILRQVEDIVVPIFTTFIVFLALVLIIWLVLRSKAQRQRQTYQLIETSMREHQPLPPSFFKNAANPDYRLSSGIVWIGFGIAFSLFFLVVGSMEMTTLGIIPISIGIARITLWLIYRKADSEPTPIDHTDTEN